MKCVRASVLLLLLSRHAGGGIDLEYDGLIAGFRAGSASVHIESESDHYVIKGHVRTTGFWDLIIPWDARFTVRGRVDNDRAHHSNFRRGVARG